VEREYDFCPVRRDELKVNDIPMIQVFNKIDLKEGWEPKVEYTEGSCKVWISAEANLGIDLLKETIAEQLHGQVIVETVVLTPMQAKLRAQLYQLGSVLTESVNDDGAWLLHIKISAAQKQRLFQES
jgi:GTP-binding protein HflX